MFSHPEITAPDPNWREKYKSLIKSPKKALAQLKPGQRILIGGGCAEPQTLVKALCDRAHELADAEIIPLLPLGKAPYAAEAMQGLFSVNCFFITKAVRKLIEKGVGSYIPLSLSDIPRLIESGGLPLDAALIQVSPPDPYGQVSLGVSVDAVKSAMENASLVIAQVNDNMPRTLGGSLINVWELDILVPANEPLLEYRPKKPDMIAHQIGRNVAPLVENGATVQVGIERLPQSILLHLKNKKDLGIHSDVLTDHIIPLVKKGAVNGSRKSLDPGKIVTSSCIGSKKLFDFVDNNPRFAFHPTEYVNDVEKIRQQFRMTAINTALEVDLTGQVAAESLGEGFFAGVGGMADFNRGAVQTSAGKAIIVLPAVTRDGGKTRIVAQLSRGSGVSATRGEVHYVVTEFGVAYLHGKSIQERAMALISIAHPDFRGKLLKKALKHHFIHPNLATVEGKILVAPQEMKTSMVMKDGTQIQFRPVHPTDEKGVRELLYSLSQASVYTRFMSNLKRFPFQQVKNFVYIDHRRDVIMVGTQPEAYGEEIVAVGGYYLEPETNRAEVAFLVRDEWQGKGIAKALMQLLIHVAKRNGIQGFTAETLPENKGMQAVFQKSGLKVRTRLESDVIAFRMDFP